MILPLSESLSHPSISSMALSSAAGESSSNTWLAEIAPVTQDGQRYALGKCGFVSVRSEVYPTQNEKVGFGKGIFYASYYEAKVRVVYH